MNLAIKFHQPRFPPATLPIWGAKVVFFGHYNLPKCEFLCRWLGFFSEVFLNPKQRYVGGSKLENPPLEVGIKKFGVFSWQLF